MSVGGVVGKIVDVCVFTMPVGRGMTWMTSFSLTHRVALAEGCADRDAVKARPFQNDLSPPPFLTNQKPPFRFRFALERSQPHVH